MEVVHRDTMWNISTTTAIIFYLLATLTVVIFLYGGYRRVRLWRRGRKERVGWQDIKQNMRSVWQMVFQQKKIKEDRAYGLMHRFTSYGFVILFIGTVLVFFDYDFNLPILRGTFYLIYEFVLDIFGILFIIGLCIALIIRARKQRARLKHSVADSSFLWLLLLIGIGGYIIEAIRLNETQVAHAVWSPIGYALAELFNANPLLALLFNQDTYVFWWMSHAVLAFALIALIPYTKLFHFLTAPIHILFKPVRRTGELSLADDLSQLPLENIYTSNQITGVSKIYDFSRWQLLSTDACTECGRCDSHCPAYLSEKPLSPRALILNIREHMQENYEIAQFIAAEELQSCTTCAACVRACPVSINHVDLILSMRRGLIRKQVLETEAENTLLRIEAQGNIWGKPWSARADWLRGSNLQVKDLSKVEEEI